MKWTFAFKGASVFGIFASTPIVLNGTVYLQDLNSNVYALDRSTGKLKWKHAFNEPSEGPNGVSYGYGHIYGATATRAFALDPETGSVLWTRKLVRNKNEGIDMTPQLYDNTVLVSTVPGNTKRFYSGHGDGIVWALDPATGKPKWKFNTLATGAKLWGHPERQQRRRPLVPTRRGQPGARLHLCRQPGAALRHQEFPNGSSRHGPNRYTNSLVVLDGQTGKLLWFRQVLPHDVRDYDLNIPAILATVPIDGEPTEVAMVAGKMGKVYAYRAADGKHLWTRSVGKHKNDIGRLPRKFAEIFPGDLGGVETPMAFADDRLFVPWLDLGTRARASGLPSGSAGALDLTKGRGGFTAVDPARGSVLWRRKLSSPNFGGATVANDVVFTSDYAGTTYAFDTADRQDALDGEGAGRHQLLPRDRRGHRPGRRRHARDLKKNPKFQLVAYSLPEPTERARARRVDNVRGQEFSST